MLTKVKLHLNKKSIVLNLALVRILKKLMSVAEQSIQMKKINWP